MASSTASDRVGPLLNLERSDIESEDGSSYVSSVHTEPRSHSPDPFAIPEDNIRQHHSQVDATQGLRSKFDSHRTELYQHLSSLESEDGKLLFTEEQIRNQLSDEIGDPEAVRSANDTTFGQTGFIGCFSVLERRIEFESDQNVPLARLFDGGHQLFEYFGDPKKVLWIHLPANNLKWVEWTIKILYGKQDGPRICRKILEQRMRAAQRAATTMPIHGRALPASCRQIRSRLTRPSGKKIGPKYDLAVFMPYLHWERSIVVVHATRIIADAQRIAKEIKEDLRLDEVAELPCGVQEKILRYHTGTRWWLHVRRTLDQSYFPMLENTEKRDREQVVDRYARGNNGKGNNIIMVDQLWLWVLNGNTVLSSFPGTWRSGPAGSDQPDNILRSLVMYFCNYRDAGGIRSAEMLAYCILNRCAGSLYDTELASDRQLDFIGMFRHSIADIIDKQSRLYQEMLSDTSPNQQGAEERFHADSEVRLLDKAKDILDELDMMCDINKEQMAVLQKLKSFRPTGNDNQENPKNRFLQLNPKLRKQILDDLVKKARYAHDAVIHLINIKQRQANLSQAISANEMLLKSQALLVSINKLTESNHRIMRESEKTGKTVMTFTVVTILFLPLSTIAGLFSVNARELNDGRLPIRIVLAYLFPLSFIIILMSLVLGFRLRTH